MPSKYELLKQYYGYERFRPGQEQLIDTLLAGRDLLAVMPTGAGKSLCYQIPALALPGLTLVVSPLISLMQDQVGALVQAGVPAAYLNSSLTAAQQAEMLRRACRGCYKIIYVAPERLLSPDFLAFAAGASVSLLAVDEAHCISQWGQNFRPSYRHIPQFIAALPQRPVVGAFTATATGAVKEDICRLLELQNPLTLTTGFDRPNLYWETYRVKDKPAALLEHLFPLRDRCGIVYCATRKNVEEVCELLQQRGYAATRYHAGLPDAERQKNQEDFLFDRKRIMVATNAFGMGIDKSNVHFIIHYNMPMDLESYYQEAGRAGRDGSPAHCILLYSPQDVHLARFLLERQFPNGELTAEQQQALRQRDLERLRQMTFYSTTKDCLRHFILGYFGEQSPAHCTGCRNCALRRQQAQKPAPEGYKHFYYCPPEKAAAVADTQELLGRLFLLRKQLAGKQKIPAYLIFTDATLREFCRIQPTSEQELLTVPGVGEAKARRYGAQFLACVRRWKNGEGQK